MRAHPRLRGVAVASVATAIVAVVGAGSFALTTSLRSAESSKVSAGVEAFSTSETTGDSVVSRLDVTSVPDEKWSHESDPDRVTTTGQPGPGSPTAAPADSDDDRPQGTRANPIVQIEAEPLGSIVRLTLPVTPSGAPLTSLVVDLGDGDIVSAGSEELERLGSGGSLVVVHEFEPTLTYQRHRIVARIADVDGGSFETTYRFGTRAYYILTYSPMKVTALNDCDTFGKGDFTLSWNIDGRDRHEDFDLGKNESYTVDRFATSRYGIHFDEPQPFTLQLRENDPTGAWLAVPWKWDLAHFRGSAAPGEDHGPVTRFGDHHYDVVRSSNQRDGIAGDDDCATRMQFRMSLHMVDDVEEAVRLMDRFG